MSWYMFGRLHTTLTILVEFVEFLRPDSGMSSIPRWCVMRTSISPAVGLLGTHILHLDCTYLVTNLCLKGHSRECIPVLVSCVSFSFLWPFRGLAPCSASRLDSILCLLISLPVSFQFAFPCGYVWPPPPSSLVALSVPVWSVLTPSPGFGII